MSILCKELILPDYVAMALINDDWTTLEAPEALQLENFLQAGKLDHGRFDCVSCEPYGFTWTNNLNNIGCNCSTYVFHVNQL